MQQTIKTLHLHPMSQHWDFGETTLSITILDEAAGSMFEITAREFDECGTIRLDLPELEQLVEAAKYMAAQPAVVKADAEAAKRTKPFEE